jgi:hypothetical protein
MAPRPYRLSWIERSARVAERFSTWIDAVPRSARELHLIILRRKITTL